MKIRDYTLRKAVYGLENNDSTPRGGIRLMPLPLRVIIGLAFGALSCGIGSVVPGIGILLTTLMFFGPMLGLICFGLCEAAGFAAWAAVTLGGCWFLGGSLLCVIYLLSVIIPCAYVCALQKRGTAFFKTMLSGFVACILGMLLSLGLLTVIYGNNLGELAAQAVKNMLLSFSDEIKTALSEYYNSIYSAMGLSVAAGSPEETLSAVSELLGEIVKVGTAGMLVLLASVNMLPGALISGFIRVKRRVPGACYESVRKWRMPLNVIIGLIVFLILGLILSSKMGSAGDVVLYTVIVAALIACCIQYAASIWDRFCFAPMSTGMRVTTVIVITLFMLQLIPLYGALSMLIGHAGLLGTIVRRRHEKHGND